MSYLGKGVNPAYALDCIAVAFFRPIHSISSDARIISL